MTLTDPTGALVAHAGPVAGGILAGAAEGLGIRPSRVVEEIVSTRLRDELGKARLPARVEVVRDPGRPPDPDPLWRQVGAVVAAVVVGLIVGILLTR